MISLQIASLTALALTQPGNSLRRQQAEVNSHGRAMSLPTPAGKNAIAAPFTASTSDLI